ncbi:DJ-1/PfpI family protein [Nocardiopsis potens]|uniref:DJ-1/PfpI family protein n=1 Tax=Nocardiopsis potens TaxID=1246458 RepID=UPI00034B8203|nr:DJ-1/PfpI family protein [Nocardiopsis potens]
MTHSGTAGPARGPVIGILFFDGVEELDAVGPWEVLSFWAAHVAAGAPRTLAISPDGRAVRCAKGLTVSADHSRDDAPGLDVLIHPGGQGTRALAGDREHLDWLRARAAATPITASVCTGSLVLAAAGLLTGRRATTHWRSLGRLAEADPGIDVVHDARFVDEGSVVTSAGVSAGIDMALHLVARLDGAAAADRVRRGIQYEPGRG